MCALWDKELSKAYFKTVSLNHLELLALCFHYTRLLVEIFSGKEIIRRL